MSSNHSLLGKRKYGDAFHADSYDDLRYGNHIGTDFFKNGGVGHGVKINSFILSEERKNNTNEDEDAVYRWCLKYLEKKGFKG
jgi:hypothetical protein